MKSFKRKSIGRAVAAALLEPLESRQLLTTIVVNTTSDATSLPSGTISLRKAIAMADSSGSSTSITFSSSVFSSSKTITLSQGVIEMKFKHSITLTGPAAHLTISGNGNDTNGGIFAIDSGNGAFNIGNVTLTGGKAFHFDNVDFLGGALYNSGATIGLSNVTISNSAADDGGAILNDGGNITLKSCLVAGNYASEFGGGIANESGAGTITLINTTVSKNSTDEQGAGIANGGGKITLSDSTISGNFTTPNGFAGGGILNNGGTVKLANTIVAGNSVGPLANGGGPDVQGAFVSLGHNLIGETDASSGWVSSDLKGSTAHPLSAKLGSLASNGGPTQTLLPQTGSPAIDAGSNSLIPSGITTDQRGLPRIAGSKVDIGAVEVQPVNISGTVFNDANASGTLDSGESGLKNVRVYVDLKNTGSYVSTDPSALTDSSGKYTITSVPTGTDVLRQVLPSGYRQTLPNNGAALKVTVGSSTVTKQNFGDTQKGRLSGFAYNDLNHDGKREANEPFLSGVTVYLDKNGNKKLDSGEPSTTTDSGGFWIIGDLSPGTYTARFDAKGNYSSYLQTQPASNGGYKATLSNGQVGDALLFGIYKPSSVKFNSEKRQVSANVESTTQTFTSTSTGTFNKTASAATSDGSAHASITSDISSSGITASGNLDAFAPEDLDGASSDIDVKFTLSSTTAYNLKYTVTGNGFSFELKKVGGSDIIGPNGPVGNNPSIENFSLNKSGSLAAAEYELIFTNGNTSSNPFETTAYTLNFAI